jgi:hypothetical protein
MSKVCYKYAANKPGYVFATHAGRPIEQRNVLRALHATGKKVGLHALRRFRRNIADGVCARRFNDAVARPLQKNRYRLLRSGVKKKDDWRREWCEKAGLGFSLVGLLGLQNVVSIDSEKAA